MDEGEKFSLEYDIKQLKKKKRYGNTILILLGGFGILLLIVNNLAYGYFSAIILLIAIILFNRQMNGKLAELKEELSSIVRTEAFEHFEEERKAKEIIQQNPGVANSNKPFFKEKDEQLLIRETLSRSEQLKKTIIDEDYSFGAFISNAEKVKLSEKAFGEIRDVAISMLKVIKDVCNQTVFIDLMKRASHTDGTVDAYWFNLKSMVIKDVLTCYRKMGYSTIVSSATPQGQALYVLLRFWTDDEEKFDYYDEYRRTMGQDDLRGILISKVYQQINIYNRVRNGATSNVGLDDFNIMLALALYKDEITEYFRMLIFRLCQILVKLDGTIFEKEKNWLMEILKKQELLEEQYTDDDGNPVPIQGKKEWIAKAEERINAVKSVKAKNTQKDKADKIENVNTPMGELSELIGLEETKKEIASLSNYIQMKQKRDEMGLKSPNVSYHCVFSGNPGTGKTTVARILAGIYRDLGVLNKGHLVETDRSGLVAEYVGQTAVKTNKIIDEALDGVLFIDEAYSLVQGGKEDYGKEAITTLLKRMEDDRDRLVVILAGYTNEIEEFINSNPGLRSRFNRYIHFPDYSAKELYDIFCFQMKKNEYTLSADASEYLKMHFVNITLNKPKDFGNARYVRNLFERAIEKQADRLATDSDLTKEKLAELRIEDFK
ncbi:MAG: AAA family ATPase [Prevotella sp.]|nr:AAA family ATPase [Prevotella sp.]